MRTVLCCAAIYGEFSQRKHTQLLMSPKAQQLSSYYCSGRQPWCGSLLSVPLCVWSTCDPGSFNTPGISNGSTMVCYGHGLDCYLHAICQDETCWDRTKTQKKGPHCRDQHSNLYVICPQSASTSPPWQLLIISTLPPPPLRWFLWMYDANTDVKERAWLSMPCDTIVCWGWVTRYNGIQPCTALLWAA